MFSGSSLHLPLPEASTGLSGSDKVSSSSSISHLCQISPPSHRQMVLVLSVDTNTQDALKRRLDVILDSILLQGRPKMPQALVACTKLFGASFQRPDDRHHRFPSLLVQRCHVAHQMVRQMVLVLSVDTNTQEARKRRLDVICRDTLTAVFLHIDPEHVIYLLQHSKSPWVHKQGLVLDSRCRPLLVSDVGRHREHSVMLTKWFVKWSWCCQLTQTLWSIRRRLHT